jgi:hypothetical protein
VTLVTHIVELRSIPDRTLAMTGPITSLLDRVERSSGMPARHAAPALLAGLALQVAVLGMYWDVGYHVDHGRDQAVLTVPHLLIVLGLQGIVFAALLHGTLGGEGGRGDRRIRSLRLRLSPGGIVMLVCGSVAMIGFPLDAIWHGLFGEDVTLWGPTHLLMIGGAGLSTLGLWMLARQGLEAGRPRRTARRVHARVTGALLIGLSTFQGEFDFGVPQFQLLFQPALIALAAGCALVCARSLLGRWGAFQALGMFLAIRGALALFVGEIAGYTTPHFPLYLAEAAVVELAALVLARRPLAFALAAGAGIGTVGFAAEWGWSHVWMAHPWPASMLPAAFALALVAGLGGAALGARVSQSLALAGSERAELPPIPGTVVAAAGAAVLVALAIPLPRTGGDGTRAAVVPHRDEAGAVGVTVTLDPPNAARGAQWFEILSWQGRTPGHTRQITHLRATGPGRFVADRPVPVGGNWKTMLRLARRSHLMGLAVSLPPSPQSGRPGEPAVPRAGRMPADTFLLRREATGGPGWLQAVAYAALAAIVAVWLALVAWALGLAEPRGGVRPRATLRRPWPPPAAPA